MSIIPPGYSPLGLAPKILIYDSDDVLQYTYISDQLGGATQDFILKSWDLHAGVNSDHGSLLLFIHDNNKSLLDTTKARILSRLIGKYKVELYLGRTAGTETLRFTGYIEKQTPIFDSTSTTEERIFCIGQGVDLAEYKTRFKFFQKKEADGETLDATDDDAKISALVTRLVVDNDHYPMIIDAMGFTATGVDNINIKLPDLQVNFQSIGQTIQDLSNIAAAYYGVTPAGDVFFRYRDVTDSGMLVINMDNSAVIKNNWDQDKIMFLIDMIRSWDDEVTEYGFSLFNGVGTLKPELDQSQSLANATLNLSANWYAFEFLPDKDTVYTVAPFLSKTLTPVDALTIHVWGEDGSNKPNPLDERMTRIISGTQLNTELASSKHFEINANNLKVTPGERLFIVFEIYSDATNFIGLDYQTGTGSYYSSADGATWSAAISGDVKFREYFSKSTNIICENTVARRQFGDRQLNVPLANFKSNATALKVLEGVALNRGKIKRSYPSLRVSVPTDLLEPGKILRIKDSRSGLDIYANLIGYNISGSSLDPQSNEGATEMDIFIEEWTY